VTNRQLFASLTALEAATISPTGQLFGSKRQIRRKKALGGSQKQEKLPQESLKKHNSTHKALLKA
jgi:hypothetical protein